ncbi:MAG: type II toxin-antitoxin system VapC family toxin [Thermoplasmatota archaeon]
MLVDSNVWAYCFDAGAKEHPRVKTALPRMLGDDDLLMPTVVQIEVVHYLVKRLGKDAGPAVDTFLAQAAEVEPLTGGIVAEAARLLVAQRATGIGGRDAALLVMAKRHAATLLTNDRDLAKVAKAMGIPVANPASP